ncbi:hypothetical protein [Halodesulfovibrio aestuarii]|uniref:Uncharacterized protein n=1 Tax=Halodesulfovibrio aestuarii TaxID=126333 RepID=A0ABV4JQW5_9BACT
MSTVVARTEKVQDWLLSNKWGRLFLIILASFFLTPNKFKTMTESEKSIYARLQSVQVVFTVSSFVAYIVSCAISENFKSRFPNIDGLTGAEYSNFIGKISLYSFGDGFFWATLVIVLYSLCEVGCHRLYVWWAEGRGKSMDPVSIHYFILMNASGLLCFVLLGCFGAAVFLYPELVRLELLFELIEKHPFYTFIAGYGIVWVENRRTQVKKDKAFQLYPNRFFRIVAPLVVFSFFIICLWGIVVGITNLLLLLCGVQ